MNFLVVVIISEGVGASQVVECDGVGGMSHIRKDSDAPPLQHEPSELQSLVVTIHTHSRLASVRFYNFWHYTDFRTKCGMAKRFLRTKQILIILTSFLFIFGTIW